MRAAKCSEIIRHCRHLEARATAIMAFYTGMHLGELVRAVVEDDALVVYDTKNGDAIKRIPMPPRAARYAHLWPLTCSKKTVQAWHQYRDMIDTDHVARSAPDGHTILVNSPNHTIGENKTWRFASRFSGDRQFTASSGGQVRPRAGGVTHPLRTPA